MERRGATWDQQVVGGMIVRDRPAISFARPRTGERGVRAERRSHCVGRTRRDVMGSFVGGLVSLRFNWPSGKLSRQVGERSRLMMALAMSQDLSDCDGRNGVVEVNGMAETTKS